MDRDRKDAFRKRLLATFKVEAGDYIKVVGSGLMELEQAYQGQSAPNAADTIETVYRAFHSLKGASRAVNIVFIESLCQAMESVFSALKRKEVLPERGFFDIFYRALDIIRDLVAASDTGDADNPQREPKVSGSVRELISLLPPATDRKSPAKTRAQSKNEKPPGPQETSGDKKRPAENLPGRAQGHDTVRISSDKLSSMLLHCEDMLSSRQSLRQNARALGELSSMVAQFRDRLKKEYLSRGRHGAPAAGGNDINEFFYWSQKNLKAIEKKLAETEKASRQSARTISRMIDGLNSEMKSAMLLPFSAVLEGFALLVHEVARGLGKEAALTVKGETLEADRRILERLKDPLTHLVRNSIGHGIEFPSDRVASGKPRRGTISIDIAYIEGNKVELIISDDGAGIDIQAVKDAAVKDKVITEQEAAVMEPGEAVYLIFKSGMSTSPVITGLSGRGLGLAIVQETVEKLNGTVTVTSGKGKGAAFRILLPLEFATFRGIAVKASDREFIIPTLNVEKTVRLRADQVRTVENRDVLMMDGRPVSFVRLESVLDLRRKKKQNGEEDFIEALFVSSGEKKIAFGVDDVAGEEEVLIKGLGPQLARVRNIAGVAISANGTPVPVLNTHDLVRSAVKSSPAPQAQPTAKDQGRRKEVLVVEDSITSRILLQNIIESAGYGVKTAIDGVDALTLLKTGEFDLVISDVEMPRMDGFELTRKIREDKRLADLPVILVTALETRRDREEGINAGANAYIIKSSFNQGNLLDVIRKLITPRSP